MKIGRSLKNNIVLKSFPFYNIYGGMRTFNIHGNNINSLFLKNITDGDYVIIPSPLLFNFIQYNTIDGINLYKSNIIAPLSYEYPANYKSVESLINNLLCYMPQRDRFIRKITSEKYGTYYGSEGMILNSEYKCLYLTAVKCKYENNKIIIDSLLAYVDPSVSVSESGVEKHIYTKIIPTIITEDINNRIIFNIPYVETRLERISKVNVIFANINDLFIDKPIAPDFFMNQKINYILNESIDEIVDTMNLCR